MRDAGDDDGRSHRVRTGQPHVSPGPGPDAGRRGRRGGRRRPGAGEAGRHEVRRAAGFGPAVRAGQRRHRGGRQPHPDRGARRGEQGGIDSGQASVVGEAARPHAGPGTGAPRGGRPAWAGGGMCPGHPAGFGIPGRAGRSGRRRGRHATVGERADVSRRDGRGELLHRGRDTDPGHGTVLLLGAGQPVRPRCAGERRGPHTGGGGAADQAAGRGGDRHRRGGGVRERAAGEHRAGVGHRPSARGAGAHRLRQRR